MGDAEYLAAFRCVSLPSPGHPGTFLSSTLCPQLAWALTSTSLSEALRPASGGPPSAPGARAQMALSVAAFGGAAFWGWGWAPVPVHAGGRGSEAAVPPGCRAPARAASRGSRGRAPALAVRRGGARGVGPAGGGRRREGGHSGLEGCRPPTCSRQPSPGGSRRRSSCSFTGGGLGWARSGASSAPAGPPEWGCGPAVGVCPDPGAGQRRGQLCGLGERRVPLSGEV